MKYPLLFAEGSPDRQPDDDGLQLFSFKRRLQVNPPYMYTYIDVRRRLNYYTYNVYTYLRVCVCVVEKPRDLAGRQCTTYIRNNTPPQRRETFSTPRGRGFPSDAASGVENERTQPSRGPRECSRSLPLPHRQRRRSTASVRDLQPSGIHTRKRYVSRGCMCVCVCVCVRAVMILRQRRRSERTKNVKVR